MPEGDTLFRTAQQLRRAIDGRRIIRASSPRGTFGCERLAGDSVISTESRGKHLLIHLGGGGAIHSHLGMTGSWHLYPAGQRWHKPTRYAELELNFDRTTCVCFTPKTLELLSDREIRYHAHLSRLGPDLLGAQFDLQQAIARFRQHGAVRIGEAVMNQTLVCGIGNIYKSEVLFIERINPFATVDSLTEERLTGLINRAQKLLRRNIAGNRRRTRFGCDGQRHWVYGRSGENCLKCGRTIQMRRQGDLGRSTYWCRECQAASPSTDPFPA